jgi:hypothetical protein
MSPNGGAAGAHKNGGPLRSIGIPIDWLGDIPCMAESNRAWRSPDLKVERPFFQAGHADFESRIGSPEAIYFNRLPGRPLLVLHHREGLCTADSRKTPASSLYGSQPIRIPRAGRDSIPEVFGR